MKCHIVKMRLFGTKLTKDELSRDIASALRREDLDDLEILDTRENHLNRIVKLARRTYRSGSDSIVEFLFEPHVLWMNEFRFVLTGFEQKKNNGQVVDYAQSWLCDVGMPTEEAAFDAPHSYRGRRSIL